METIRRYLPLVGRILIAAIFVSSGFSKFANWDSTAGYMAAKGLPAVPLLLVLAALTELLGGLSLLVGFKASAGAGLLALFLVPTTLVFHAFWTAPAAEAMTQSINFMKNIAIIGGLVSFAAYGAGAVSVDAFLQRRGVPERRREVRDLRAA